MAKRSDIPIRIVPEVLFAPANGMHYVDEVCCIPGLCGKNSS